MPSAAPASGCASSCACRRWRHAASPDLVLVVEADAGTLARAPTPRIGRRQEPLDGAARCPKLHAVPTRGPGRRRLLLPWSRGASRRRSLSRRRSGAEKRKGKGIRVRGTSPWCWSYPDAHAPGLWICIQRLAALLALCNGPMAQVGVKGRWSWVGPGFGPV